MRREVPVALPSVMVGFDLAFEKLGLRELRGSTVASNRSVISINRKCGFRQVNIEPASQVIGGKSVDMAHFVLAIEDWARAREDLAPLARVAEAQILDWECAQR